MVSRSTLSMDELNEAALERFFCQPLNNNMISYLVDTANNIIACDPNIALQSTEYQGGQYIELRAVCNTDKKLPTLKEFITRLVNSSKVPVPILMSTLVYLSRYRSKLQLPPMEKSIRCGAHRIFLGALIISGRYHCDSSPENRHWAEFTYINSEYLNFTCAEVDRIEAHVLRQLNWELTITGHDLYRELEYFLKPLRDEIDKEHACKIRYCEEELYAVAALQELCVPLLHVHLE